MAHGVRSYSLCPLHYAPCPMRFSRETLVSRPPPELAVLLSTPGTWAGKGSPGPLAPRPGDRRCRDRGPSTPSADEAAGDNEVRYRSASPQDISSARPSPLSGRRRDDRRPLTALLRRGRRCRPAPSAGRCTFPPPCASTLSRREDVST